MRTDTKVDTISASPDPQLAVASSPYAAQDPWAFSGREPPGCLDSQTPTTEARLARISDRSVPSPLSLPARTSNRDYSPSSAETPWTGKRKASETRKHRYYKVPVRGRTLRQRPLISRFYRSATRPSYRSPRELYSSKPFLATAGGLPNSRQIHGFLDSGAVGREVKYTHKPPHVLHPQRTSEGL